MTQTRVTTGQEQAAVPQEFANVANLMVHPLAGAAAFGAIGLGVASHMMGLWCGATTGAAEVARKALEGARSKDVDAAKPGRKAASLKLVVSKPGKAERPAAKASRVGSKPAQMEKPTHVDDLKAITGIGPKLEKVLNELGIWTWAQIAALKGAEIAWLEDQFGFSGRIERDDWIGQARALDGAA